jgi:hypothetical protein
VSDEIGGRILPRNVDISLRKQASELLVVDRRAPFGKQFSGGVCEAL